MGDFTVISLATGYLMYRLVVAQQAALVIAADDLELTKFC